MGKSHIVGAIELYKQGKLALIDTVQSFDVFKTNNGNQGGASRPDRQTLTEVFGSADEKVVVDYILRHGKPHGHSTSNINRSPGGTYNKP